MIEQLSVQMLVRVSVPRDDFWNFLAQFGKKFALKGIDDLGREFETIRPVESYTVDWGTPERMMVNLLLSLGEEGKFRGFCKDFSHESKAQKEIPVLHDAIAKGEETPTCPSCGTVCVRNGNAFKCLNCGETLGSF